MSIDYGLILTPCDRFQALLRYLYTNEIEFAPWGSEKQREARVVEGVSEPNDIPEPSPKSMYRLADKVVNNHIAIVLELILLLVRYSGAEEARITANSA